MTVQTRPGGPRERREDRADAARQDFPTLKNPLQNDYGPKLGYYSNRIA